MKRPPTLIDAMADPRLFAPWFRTPASWSAWRAFLGALFALPLSDDQLAVYRECTGRSEPPTAPCREAWLVCGRRAGKSFVLALVAVYLAAFHDYRRHLQPGERGTVMVLARDRKQARTILRYIKGLLTGVPMLQRLIEREEAEAIDLTNAVSIEVHTATYRGTRGYTVIAALLDEIAYWPTDDSAEPDHEVISALKPAMATIPNSMLLCASNPHARRGALWDAYRKHYGNDGDDVLVWHAPTRTMNPTIKQGLIDTAIEEDPAKAGAEWMATFRSDVETFISREVVEACTVRGRHELPPASGVRYAAFVDPSGGSADSMTLSIAHKEASIVVIDLIREVRPPFSPDAVVAGFADVLKPYRVTKVTGDRFAGEWCRERFRAHSVAYDLAEKPKSEIFLEALPLLNSHRIELLDHPRGTTQLVGLERTTTRSGRDMVNHAPGAHDDVVNAVLGAAMLAMAGKAPIAIPDEALAWARQPTASHTTPTVGTARGRDYGAAMPTMPSVSFSDLFDGKRKW